MKELSDKKAEKQKLEREGGGVNPFGKWWFWVIVVVVAVVVFSDTPDDTQETEPTMSVVKEKSNKTQQTEEKATQKPEMTETAKDYRKGMYGVSEKDVKDTNIYFGVTKVKNDTTDKWKISTISENIDILDYALSYYKEYFKDNTEVHVIVNFATSTTTKITVAGNQLDVSVFDYVDKEEHDAKILFSGNLLKEYSVYLDNGDIEEIK